MSTSWKNKPDQSKGVLCACDSSQEWLLPWWWERYSFYNNYPVLFCDYGMSEKAKAWCSERGKVAPVVFDEAWIRPEKDIPPLLQKQWTKTNKLWRQSRSSWFKKPFAMLLSPFKTTLFLDLDCEVLSPLGKLFEYCSSDLPLAISSLNTKTDSQLFGCPIAHNGGVVVFQHGIDIIPEQGEMILNWNHQFLAEDNVLTYLINKRNYPVFDLPKEWNWLAIYGINLYSHIFHWHCVSKNYLKTHDGIKPLRDSLEQSFCYKSSSNTEQQSKVHAPPRITALTRASAQGFCTPAKG